MDCEVLSVSELTFSFKHKTLFKNVSFSLEASQLLHITGPNGSGKTTLLGILAGLIAPQIGKVTFTSTSSKPSRDFCEYLPSETNNHFLKMDAMQNLRFWGSLRHGELADEKIIAALKVWNLSHPLVRKNFPVERFSTGMKRRLALARLALSEAKIWLLDEPIWGLDDEATNGFTALLSEHLQKGRSAIVITHDLNPIKNLVSKSLDLCQFGGSK